MKKRFVFVILLAVVLLSVAGCVGAGQPAEPEEVKGYAPIIQNGKSDYTIVYDGTPLAKLLAERIQTHIEENFRVQLPVAPMAEGTDTEKAILIGDCNDSAKAIREKLTGEFDFAVKVYGSTLILCAKDMISYTYFGAYLEREVFVNDRSNGLVLETKDNLVYSQSALMQKNYVEYMLEGGQSFTLEELFGRGECKEGYSLLSYRIYIPFNYSPDKSYPVFLNLHGAGHRGVDNAQHLKFIMPLLKNPQLPLDEMIIIFPQCPGGERWVDTDWAMGSYDLDQVPESNEFSMLMELIGQLQEKYSIDEKRMYVAGLSMGGYGTWNLLMQHPDVFCAGIPMCGAGDPDMAETLVDIPIWAVHGTLDPTVPVSGSREMVEAIKAAGGEKIRYTELSDHEHDVWTYTYNNFEMFQWLFSQSKP